MTVAGRAAVAPADARAEREPRVEPANERGVAIGWLCVLPLVLAYELAVLRSGAGAARNTAEVLLTLPFERVLASGAILRWSLEIAASAAAAWHVFHADLALVPRFLRVVAEGLAAAIVIGPLLLVATRILSIHAPSIGRPASLPSADAVALLAGGSAFEEIVFRVGAQSALYVLARVTCTWFLGVERSAAWIAEIVAIGGGALLFAAAHLSGVVALLGSGGEAFDARIFAWRALAGLALALVFRWRGVGVAAWAHAFFNVALALGAGPGVLA